MPSGVFSHQAPGLLLKIKYPHKFDGTALCLSMVVPDLHVLIDPLSVYTLRNITHSLVGIFLLTVPVTLLFTIIFCRYVGPFCASLARRKSLIFKPWRYFGVDEWIHLKKKKYNRRYFIVASYSALIGGLIHLLLDLPAHEFIELFFPWVILQNPDFLLYSIIDFGTITVGQIQIDRNFTIFQLIWIIETLITLVITLYLLRYIKKRNLVSKWYGKT